jgi:hypothetical protein
VSSSTPPTHCGVWITDAWGTELPLTLTLRTNCISCIMVSKLRSSLNFRCHHVVMHDKTHVMRHGVPLTTVLLSKLTNFLLRTSPRQHLSYVAMNGYVQNELWKVKFSVTKLVFSANTSHMYCTLQKSLQINTTEEKLPSLTHIILF